MRRDILAFVSGALFTLGLTVAGMTEPRKVQGFLDFAGAWDPSLAFVMLGAVAVYALSYQLSRRREAPWHCGEFSLPSQRRIDARLVAGAAVFGVGWGLAGLCPGPAWSALGTGNATIVLFVAALLGGMLLVRTAETVAAGSARRAPPAGGAARDG
jgi:uncharacterized membrane protein YedE/YeeE